MSVVSLPNLIVAGVVKGGSTSLYAYLSRHPEICASSIKETNYFMPLVHGKELPEISQYANYFKKCNGTKYIMEATPRYIYGGEIIAKGIYKRLGLIKILFILRNPVERLFSFYKHMKGSLKIPKVWCFNEYANHCLNEFKKAKKVREEMLKNIFILSITEGCYSDYLHEWYPIFGESIKVSFFDDLKKDPLSLMCDLCDWLCIDASIYLSEKYNVENRSFMYKNEQVHRFAQFLNLKMESFFRRNYKLKNYIRNVYYILNEKTGYKEEISPELYERLSIFYERSNYQLYELLSSKGYSKFPSWVR